MAIISILVGVIGVVVSLILIILNIMDKESFGGSFKENKYFYIIFLISILLISSIGIGSKPIASEEDSFISNRWNGVNYSCPMVIEYTIYSYNWWTYEYLNSSSHMENIRMRPYEMKEIK